MALQGGFCREAALYFASDLIAIGLRRMGAKTGFRPLHLLFFLDRPACFPP